MMSPLERALDYIGRGWAPIPIAHKSKNPNRTNWHLERYTAETAARAFNGRAQNIGIIMGAASHDLCDVDCDWPEARATALYFLPPTMIFGRPSSRGARYLYTADLWRTVDKAKIKFPFPDVEGRKPDILELLIGGGGLAAQVVAPGSTHESDEYIEWENTGVEQPASINGTELLCRLGRVASAALLAHFYPQQGGRHDAANVIGGIPARAGFGGTPMSELLWRAAGHRPAASPATNSRDADAGGRRCGTKIRSRNEDDFRLPRLAPNSLAIKSPGRWPNGSITMARGKTRRRLQKPGGRLPPKHPLWISSPICHGLATSICLHGSRGQPRALMCACQR